jgi:hypothetical protein
MDPPSPAAAELRELADKYRALAQLRGRRDGGGAPAGAPTLRALAAKHPGCLRELDTLGLGELERRACAADAAAEGGAREPWMAWIWAYHRLMRAALATKRALGGAPPPPDRMTALAAEAQRLAGFALEARFVTEVAAPPQGRLAVLVLRRLGDLFAQPPRTIADTLFPPRRPPPYTLEEP